MIITNEMCGIVVLFFLMAFIVIPATLVLIRRKDIFIAEEPTITDEIKQILGLKVKNIVDYNADTDKNIIPISLLRTDDEPKAKLRIYDKNAHLICEYAIFKNADGITYYPYGGIMICFEKRNFYWIELKEKATVFFFDAEKEEEIMPEPEMLCYIK